MKSNNINNYKSSLTNIQKMFLNSIIIHNKIQNITNRCWRHYLLEGLILENGQHWIMSSAKSWTFILHLKFSRTTVLVSSVKWLNGDEVGVCCANVSYKCTLLNTSKVWEFL